MGEHDKQPWMDNIISSSVSANNHRQLQQRRGRLDTWERGRRFGIVVDAGSSGSRLQVYSWLDHAVARSQRASSGHSIAVLPRIEKGVESGQAWTLKVEPGISSFASNPQDVGAYLTPLFDHARSIIPPSQLASTPVYILATAGMRLLPVSQSQAILSRACDFIRTSTPFRLTDCDSQIRIISGEEEGIYGWVAVNYLMDGFDSHGIADKGKGKHSSTYGFLDMGGASTQIAFEPSTSARKEHADNLLSVDLRLLDGVDVHHPVFVTTWLGYGTNQARERYVDALIKSHDEANPEADHVADIASERPLQTVSDPCLPKSLLLSETRHKGYTLQGTGDFAACMLQSAPLLNKAQPCPDEPCLMGVHVPPIDFQVNHFIGVSEYWYSSQELWSLGGVYDFPTFEKSALEFCSQNWDAILKSYREGGSKYHPETPIPEQHRLEMQCFKAAWIVNVLHDGIGIPRLALDAGAGGSSNKTEEALLKAGEKGFAKAPPTFQSVNDINDVAVSWTLGRMVLEATDSIPRAKYQPAAHDEEVSSITPEFEWKHGGGRSWTGTLSNGLRYAYTHPTPIAAVSLTALLLLILSFGCCLARKRRNRSAKDAYKLVAMEEGGDESVNGDDLGSPVKKLPSTPFSRSMRPFRHLADRVSTAFGRPSRRSRRNASMPTSSGSHTPNGIASHHTSVASATTDHLRPTRNLRHIASSPAIFRNSPPARTSSLPASSSLPSIASINGRKTKSRIDVSAASHYADSTDTPPLTPPARSDSPAWSLRSKNGSPRHINGTASASSYKSTSAHKSYPSSDSDGYLSVPFGLSSTTAPTNGTGWDGGTSSTNDEEGLACAYMPSGLGDDGNLLGMRSRNSSYTNLNSLARQRGGHTRQGSMFPDVTT